MKQNKPQRLVKRFDLVEAVLGFLSLMSIYGIYIAWNGMTIQSHPLSIWLQCSIHIFICTYTCVCAFIIITIIVVIILIRLVLLYLTVCCVQNTIAIANGRRWLRFLFRLSVLLLLLVFIFSFSFVFSRFYLILTKSVCFLCI